ncbi:MAG: endonuclease III [Spirochaetales bacterium]|nr:endonuclease III [Spirochaetales bacterium]
MASSKISKIFDILSRVYRETPPLLKYSNPYEMIVSTILAAQCTDERVNQVTPELFRKFPEPEKLSQAGLEEIEQIIRPTGFFHNKAKSLKNFATAITEEYKGRIPSDMDSLVKLPGIGRKTANVVLGVCFDQPAIIVDTHFKRVTARLGLTTETNPDKIEMDLKKAVPEKQQTRFSGLVNYHGRYRCHARKPDCENCEIRSLCPFPDEK